MFLRFELVSPLLPFSQIGGNGGKLLVHVIFVNERENIWRFIGRGRLKKIVCEWYLYLTFVGICESSSIGQSVRGSNVVLGELKSSKPSFPLTE